AVMRAPSSQDVVRRAFGRAVMIPRSPLIREGWANGTGLIQGRLIRQHAASGKRPPMREVLRTVTNLYGVRENF
ncbi:MAG: hypothetical protein Q7T73_20215, partial [Beijerinckiaceae bacterium]|nr:hypothetical protein [Beijerinckiaceae bacterium]